jgi:hypothetical protein
MHEIGPYQLVGVDAERQIQPAAIILDTNVAIDIERFYFGESTIDRDALKALLLTFPYNRSGPTVDLNYGFAMAETSWARDGTFRSKKVRSLRHAVTEVLDWSPVEVERAFANRNPPVNRDKRWPTKVPEPGIAELGGHPLPILLNSYASLLYLRHLDSTRREWRGRGTKWAFINYIEWLNDSLGIRGAYEIAAGVDLFFGNEVRQNAVRRLLKIGGNEAPDELADRTWNAAWDLLFVRLTDGATFGLLPIDRPPRITCLVTRNFDPGLVRSASKIASVVSGTKEPAAFVMSSWSESEKIDSEIMNIVEQDHVTSYSRMNRDVGDLMTQGLSALRQLESEIGVERSTVRAFLDYGLPQ